jgi:hypothetical protein
MLPAIVFPFRNPQCGISLFLGRHDVKNTLALQTAGE